MIIHGKDDTPTRSVGVMVSPGYITYAQIKKEQVEQCYNGFLTYYLSKTISKVQKNNQNIDDMRNPKIEPY